MMAADGLTAAEREWLASVGHPNDVLLQDVTADEVDLLVDAANGRVLIGLPRPLTDLDAGTVAAVFRRIDRGL